MRQHHSTQEGFRIATIALGNEKPVKEFIELKFANKGDMYLFDELLPGTDQKERHHHLSIHASGMTYHRSPAVPHELGQRDTGVNRLGPAVQELTTGTVNLADDYFYEGHRTVGLEKTGQIVVWSPYRLIVGSKLRWSLDLVNTEEDSIINQAVEDRFRSFEQDRHAFSFSHQGRTVVVCMEFSGGNAAVDDQKVKKTDNKKLEHHRVWLHDIIKIS